MRIFFSYCVRAFVLLPKMVVQMRIYDWHQRREVVKFIAYKVKRNRSGKKCIGEGQKLACVRRKKWNEKRRAKQGERERGDEEK